MPNPWYICRSDCIGGKKFSTYWHRSWPKIKCLLMTLPLIMDLHTEDDQSFADLLTTYQKDFLKRPRQDSLSTDPPRVGRTQGKRNSICSVNTSSSKESVLIQILARLALRQDNALHQFGLDRKFRFFMQCGRGSLAFHARDRPEMEQPTPKWRRLGLIASHNIPHHFSGIV